MYVLSIKVLIRKKSGNLSNDHRIYIYIYIYIYDTKQCVFVCLSNLQEIVKSTVVNKLILFLSLLKNISIFFHEIFFTPVLTSRFSLKSVWQEVSSGLWNSSKWQQVSMTLLRFLPDLTSGIVWMAWILPLVFNSFTVFRAFRDNSSAQISITATFMF